jgi:PAS domain S-box-containing protein
MPKKPTYEEIEQRVKELEKEAAKSKQVQQELKLNEARLNALFQLNRMTEISIDEIASFTLEKGIILTGSKIGFLGTLSKDEEVYTLHAISKDLMKDCKVEGDPMQWHVSEAGIWADAIRKRKTLFFNDYSIPHPNKQGIPQGHVSLQRFIIVPVFEKGRIVAVAGMGNKDTDYEMSDERQISLLIIGMWQYLQRNRKDKDLRKLNNELERRVEERTVNLEKTNQHLKEEIKEHKRAEDALREREEKYRNLFNNAEVGMFRTRIDGSEILDMNEKFLDIFGCTREEMQDSPSLIHWANPSEREEMVHRLDLEGRVPNFECGMLNKQGEVRTCLTSLVLFREQGILEGSIMDITERKQAEEVLRESQQVIEGIINTIPVRVFWKDKNLVFLGCNALFAHDAGFNDPKDIIGKDDYQMVWCDQAELYRGDDRQVIESGRPKFLIEEPQTTPQGNTITLLTSKIPLRSSTGEIRGVLGTYMDITERKQAEEALRASEEKYRLLVKNITGVVYKGYKDWSVEFFDKKIELVVGYTADDFNSKRMKWNDIIVEEDIETAREVFINALKTDKSYVREYRIKCKACDIQWIQERGYIVCDNKGEIDFVSGVFFNITERKRAEEELLRSQKLESVAILAGGIAHDFNNILTTILGNVSMARMQARPEDEIFDLLSESEAASIRAQALTKQLLTFAKGGMPLKETASIKDIIKQSSLFVLRGSKSKCEFSIAEDLWPAEVDIGQISQVINNIVINANQAMPDGVIIKVAAENLIIEDGYGLPIKPGRHIKISITDQGVGIAENHLLNIFDPYFTTKQEGSGLGLATTYSIIKKHEGHITVESRLRIGTTFHIYLPASEKTVSEKDEFNLIKGRGRVLVMDDEASLRKMTGRMLENLGYKPEFAKDGAEAIESYKKAIEAEKPYDAVILDLTIPGGMGGKDAVKKLLEISPEVKAIVSSGYSDDRVLSNFQEYGFKGVMPKPFESLSLSKVLHEVLQGKGKN